MDRALNVWVQPAVELTYHLNTHFTARLQPLVLSCFNVSRFNIETGHHKMMVKRKHRFDASFLH